MLVKLKFVLNQSIVKKLVIIFLAILIASITTSFSFGMRSAYGADELDAATTAQLTANEAKLERLKAIRDVVSPIINRGEITAANKAGIIKTLEGLMEVKQAEVEKVLERLNKDEFAKTVEVLGEYLGTVTKAISTTTEEIATLKREAKDEASDKKSTEVAKADCEGPECDNPELKIIKELKAAVSGLVEKSKKQDEKIESLEEDRKAFKKEITELISKLSRSILQRFTQATFKDASNEDLVTQWQKKLSHAVVMRSAAVSFGKKMEELESKIDKDFEDFQDFDSYEDIEDEQFGDLSTHKKKKLKDLLDARENLKKRTTVLVANAEQNMWSIDALGFEIKKRQSEGKLDGKMLTQNVDPRGQRVVTQANIPQIIVPATQQVQQPVQPAGQTVTSGEQIIREALLRDIQRGNSQVKQFNGGFQPSPTQGAVGRGARVGTSSLSSASSSPRGNSTMDLIRFAQGS